MRTLLVVAVLALAGPAAAHDYWLVPSEHVVTSDRDVPVAMYVGENLVIEDEFGFERARTPRVNHVHHGQIDDLRNRSPDNVRPMLQLPVRGAGGHLLAIDRVPATVELDAAKFETYLREEGLDHVIAERARRGEAAARGRERYQRYIKTLVQHGSTRDDTYARVLDQTLEIIPEADPSFLAPGAKLPVRVMFRGQPLAGVRVAALSRNTEGVVVVRSAAYRTDANGRAQIAIDRRGTWLVRAVHMHRCEQGCAQVEWDSYWGAYTFANTAAAPAGSDHTQRYAIIVVAILALACIGWFLAGRR